MIAAFQNNYTLFSDSEVISIQRSVLSLQFPRSMPAELPQESLSAQPTSPKLKAESYSSALK